MTTITKLKAALAAMNSTHVTCESARHAKKDLGHAFGDCPVVTRYAVAMSGLDDVIAEMEAGEPVAWQWMETGTFRKNLPEDAEKYCWRPLYAAAHQEKSLILKERPDFMAGYDAGMADAKRMADEKVREQSKKLYQWCNIHGRFDGYPNCQKCAMVSQGLGITAIKDSKGDV